MKVNTTSGRDIKRADIEKFQRDIADGKTAADVKTGPRGRVIVEGGKGTSARTVGLLGGIFTFAVNHHLCAENPVHGVKRLKDKKAERFLSAAEFQRLGAALESAEAEGENQNAIAALRLLMLTGCRKSEILSLKWAFVDFAWGCLRLPDSKTGAKVVPLGQAALALLENHPHQEGSPYVFPSEKTDGYFIGLPKVWIHIKTRAILLHRLGPQRGIVCC